MARISELTTESESASEYRLPVHSGITGYADIIVQTTVHFESVEVMDAFCSWVTEQRSSLDTSVVRTFIEAAEKARNEAERIRESLRR